MASNHWRSVNNLSGVPVVANRPAPIHITLRGMTLAQVEEYAIRACYDRHRGHRARMMAELGIAKSTLLAKLDALGLRKRRVRVQWRP
jgi:DNA-binding NtrC family response regulator